MTNEANITLNATQTSTVEKMIKAGKSYSAISATMLALDFVSKAEQAEEILKGMGVVKGRKGNIVDSMYDFLQAKPRTQDEFYSWIKENGTENTWRWRKAHDKVRELAVRLHVELTGIVFEEKLYSETSAELTPEPAKAEPARKPRKPRKTAAKKEEQTEATAA